MNGAATGLCTRCGEVLLTSEEEPSGICALCYWDEVYQGKRRDPKTGKRPGKPGA